METSAKVVFYLACLFLGETAQKTHLKMSSSFHQESGLISANVGESVTLRCFYGDDESVWLYWYKQTLGQRPKLISSFYVYDTKISYFDEFKNNPRFTVDTENNKFHLKILDVQISDSAAYYCASSVTFDLNFAEGITVIVKGSGSNFQGSVHQSASESIQPGGSVTLNCTVHTGTCDGEHSVYWFKNQDDDSQQGLIYTHGGRSDQCERKPDTQTHTCVYNLPMKSLNPSHAGTYYCAVVSCGRILFGEGAKLDFQGEVKPPVLVYFLSGALVFTTILSVILALTMCIIKTRNKKQCIDSQARLSAPFTAGPEDYQDADSLHYAAISDNRIRRQRDNTMDECVYSSVKQ